jgi:hypothetical protein
MLAHIAFPTATMHRELARESGLHRADVVLAHRYFELPGDVDVAFDDADLTITVLPADRLQEVLARAHAKFGHLDAPAFPSDEMLAPALKGRAA